MSETLQLQLSDYEIIQRPEVTVYCRRMLLQELGDKELVQLPTRLAELPARRSRSKTSDTVWTLPGKSGLVKFVVRKYHHGGVWGRIARDVFLGSQRMLRELAMCEYAWKLGVSTCQPAALRIARRFGPLCSGWLITVAIENAVNLAEFMRGGSGTLTEFERRLRFSKAIATTLQKMHDAGIYHDDLNVKNILVRDGLEGPEAFVIDFDKAVLMTHVPLDTRMRNLLRIDRSIMKWPALRERITISDRLRLVREYLGHYPQWAGQWREIVSMYRTSHGRHRLTRVRSTPREEEGPADVPEAVSGPSS